MSYLPARPNVQITSATPHAKKYLTKIVRYTPILLLALGAIMALSSMMDKPAYAEPDAISYMEFEAVPVPIDVEPEPRPEAVSDLPTIVEVQKEVQRKPKKPLDTWPRAVKEVAPINAEAYIKKYYKAAQQAQKVYGVPASISLGQGLVESNCGKSFLAQNANNHFGMKCSLGYKCGRGHCVNREDDSHKDFFLKFPSAIESYKAHGKLVTNGRYAELKRYGNNYKKWAHGLKACGYATDKTYASKVIGIIERYKLYKYD